MTKETILQVDAKTVTFGSVTVTPLGPITFENIKNYPGRFRNGPVIVKGTDNSIEVCVPLVWTEEEISRFVSKRKRSDWRVLPEWYRISRGPGCQCPTWHRKRIGFVHTMVGKERPRKGAK